MYTFVYKRSGTIARPHREIKFVGKLERLRYNTTA